MDNEERQVPDEREFLTRQGRILAEAEAKAKVRHKRKMLLINAIACLVIGAVIALLFWLVNKR